MSMINLDDGPPLDLLIKIMRMTESDNDNMTLIAIKKANAHLRKLGADWDSLLRGKVKIIGDPFANINIPTDDRRNQNSNAAPTPRPQPAPPPPPRPKRTPPPQPPKPDVLLRTIVNKWDGTCANCGHKVLAGHGLSEKWQSGTNPTQEWWRIIHAPGACKQKPPTRKPFTTNDL